MPYFRELPNLEYPSFLSDKISFNQTLLVKNIFRRVKLRDDLYNVFTLFNKYEIPDGSRPDLIAEELYGSSQYDWVVLVSAGITRIRDQWPLSDRELYSYAENLYGPKLNDIHHYETIEVRDSKNRLILPADKVVDQNYKIYYQDNNLLYTNDQTILRPEVRYIADPIKGISNYEYETKKNNEKRSIYVLKPSYLQQVISDIKKAMTYDKSSQYVDDRLIKAESIF